MGCSVCKTVQQVNNNDMVEQSKRKGFDKYDNRIETPSIVNDIGETFLVWEEDKGFDFGMIKDNRKFHERNTSFLLQNGNK